LLCDVERKKTNTTT